MKQSSHWRRDRAARKADVRSYESVEAIGPVVRQVRLERLFFEELNALLSYEVGDPDLEEVQVTTVTLSADGGHARIGFRLPVDLPPTREAVTRVGQALARAAGFFRSRLAETLDLKRIPALRFTFDLEGDAARRGGLELSEAWSADKNDHERAGTWLVGEDAPEKGLEPGEGSCTG